MSQHFSILPSFHLYLLDYSQLIDDSIYTTRRSVDGTLAVVGWEGETPDFIVWPVLTHDETLNIMATPEWTNFDPDGNNP